MSYLPWISITTTKNAADRNRPATPLGAAEQLVCSYYQMEYTTECGYGEERRRGGEVGTGGEGDRKGQEESGTTEEKR